nr:hypothetical protein CFP56_23951 [Quercus suber]
MIGVWVSTEDCGMAGEKGTICTAGIRSQPAKWMPSRAADGVHFITSFTDVTQTTEHAVIVHYVIYAWIYMQRYAFQSRLQL